MAGFAGALLTLAILHLFTIRRIGPLIEDLLDLSRIEAGKLDLVSEPFRGASSSAWAARFVWRHRGEPGARLQFRCRWPPMRRARSRMRACPANPS
jgi:signal transduction histidine kinase